MARAQAERGSRAYLPAARGTNLQSASAGAQGCRGWAYCVYTLLLLIPAGYRENIYTFRYIPLWGASGSPIEREFQPLRTRSLNGMLAAILLHSKGLEQSLSL